MAAWTTALLANSLRILVAMNLPGHGAGLHRLIGMLIYVPLLSLQLHLGDRETGKAALAGPVILYLLLMAVVPVLTGNAFNSPGVVIQHLLYSRRWYPLRGPLCQDAGSGPVSQSSRRPAHSTTRLGVT